MVLDLKKYLPSWLSDLCDPDGRERLKALECEGCLLSLNRVDINPPLAAFTLFTILNKGGHFHVLREEPEFFDAWEDIPTKR